MREERSQHGPQSTALSAHPIWGHLLTLLFATSANATGEGPAELGATDTGEFWRNTSSGVAQDAAYLDNIPITLGIDTKTLWGLPDTRISFYGLYNNGDRLAEDRYGDLQVSRNIEMGHVAARRYVAWIERDIANHGSVHLGLYDLNGEFGVLESSGLLINIAHGLGMDFGQTGFNGPSSPSIFSVTRLALRLEWRWIKQWLERLSVLDGVPGDSDDRGATVQLEIADDAMVPAGLELTLAGHRIHASACSFATDFEKRPNAVDVPKVRSDGNAGAPLRGEMAVINLSMMLACLASQASRTSWPAYTWEPVSNGSIRYRVARTTRSALHLCQRRRRTSTTTHACTSTGGVALELSNQESANAQV